MQLPIRSHLLRILTFLGLFGLFAGSVQALPDVIVTSITASPSSPTAGDTVNISTTIRNSGSSSTPSGVAVGTGIQIDGAYLGSFFVRNGSGQTIPLGVSQSFTGQSDAAWTAVEGTHQICVFVDDINRFAESNENNNSSCQNITVAPPPQPDVIITSLTLTPSNPSVGDNVVVKANIKNQGNASSPTGVAVGTGIQVDSALLGSFFVRNGGGTAIPLGANQSFLGTSNSNWTATEGSHQFCAFADDIDRFDESNENNNSYCVNVTVAPPPQPDVTITSITLSPSNPTAGDTVTVRATIKNLGDASTPSGVDVGTGIQVDGTLLGSFFVRNGGGQAIALGVNQSFLGTSDSDWTATVGTHQICAIADDINRFSESNESNNTTCINVTVAAAPLSDVRGASIGSDTPNPVAGDTISWRGGVDNPTAVDTPTGVAVVNEVRVDGNSIGTFEVRNGSGQIAPLEAGQLYVHLDGLDWLATEGSHQICVHADVNNLIEEADESNNTYCITRTVDAAPLPDAVVSDLQLSPSQPQSGDNVSIAVTLANLGGVSTPSGVPVEAIVTVDGTVIGNLTASGPLAASGSYTGSVSWIATVGSHQVCAQVDPNDRFSESNENNNQVCLNVTVPSPSLPDVIITSVTVSPSSPVDGDSVVVRATIKNVGGTSTPANVDVGTGFQVDGSLLGSFFVLAGGQTVPLAANQSYLGTSNNNWNATQGSHQICAIADDINRFTEADDNNNTTCITVEVGAAPQPDLVISGISLDPANPVDGDSVTVSATVRNDGNLSTPSGIAIRNKVRVNGSSLGEFSVVNGSGQSVPLAAGTSYTGDAPSPWSATQGSHQICAKADDPGLVGESSDTNNELCIPVTVGAPDPCVRTVNPSDFGTVGGSLLPNASTIANQMINNNGCSDVILTFTPGSYVYEPNQAHQGIDLLGDLNQIGGTATDSNVTVRFEDGDYYFNHELFFSGFSSERNLIVEGAGKDNSNLTFCQNPPSCTCVDTSSAAGCQPSYNSWGMLHFRRNPTQVVVRNLGLQGEKYFGGVVNDRNVYEWEFEIGVNLCLDGSQCRDIMIDSVAVNGAKYSVLSKNATGLTLKSSLLENHNIGYLPSTGEHRNVLVYDNDIENDVDDILNNTKYGIFANGPLIDSAVVKNRIKNVKERGIYPASGTDGLWIHDNTISNAGVSGSGAGVNLGKESINDVLVSGNDITGIGGGLTTRPLGSLPITNADEMEHDQNSDSVRSTTIWPNHQWNGYGITVSGSNLASGGNSGGGSDGGGFEAVKVDGAIGLVKNIIGGASSHGIKINPGSSRVMVYLNEISGSGVNGLTIVPGYPYEGEFGYDPRGGIGDVWVQDNTFNYNSRGGIEIVPRGTPLFGVPAECETPQNCLQAQNRFGVCGHTSGLCVPYYNPSTCGSQCYQKSWQSYQVDMHANTVKYNNMANLIIDGIRQPGSNVDVHYTISGMTSDTIEPGRTSNFHIYPNEHTGQAALSSDCVSHDEGTPKTRASNTAVVKYNALVDRVETFSFRVFRNNEWVDTVLWDDTSFPYESINFTITAPTTCGSGGTKPKGDWGFGNLGGR